MKLTTKTVTKTVTVEEILPVIEIQFSDLVVFLEEHNALEGYLRSFQHYRGRGGPLYEFLKKQSPRNWFNSAFVWGNTQEGYNYWRVLHIEWNSHLDFLEKRYRTTIPDPEEEN